MLTRLGMTVPDVARSTEYLTCTDYPVVPGRARYCLIPGADPDAACHTFSPDRPHHS